MEDQFYYSTGKAAQELGASQDAIRALCNSGVIRALPTNGRQWRIPAREIERLKREGLPPVPRPMPGDSPMTRNVSTRHRMNGDHDDDADPHRAAGREPEVVQAYAGAARKHALIEEREADWRLQELEDRFRQREDEIQTRQRKRESEAQRADWLREAEQVALSSFDKHAPDAPPQMRFDLHRAIRERLGSLNPIPTPQVTAELTAGIVKPFVERQREQEEAEKIIIKARDNGLPVDARAKPWAKELSQWQIKLLRTIRERMGDGDYPLDTIRTVVKEVVVEVTREFEAHQAGERDRELREQVKGRARYSIPFRLNNEGRELAIQAIEEAINRLPQETPEAKLKAAADAALQPFRDAIARNAEEQRRRATRESVVAGASWKLPLGFPIPERDAALAAARRAVEQQPEHADRRELEAARDRSLEPFLAAYERRTLADQRRRAAEARIDAMLLDAVDAAITEMEQSDGLEFDLPTGRVDLKWEVKDVIRQPLIDWAAGINNLTDKVLEREIQRVVRHRILQLVPER